MSVLSRTDLLSFVVYSRFICIQLCVFIRVYISHCRTVRVSALPVSSRGSHVEFWGGLV